MFLPIYAGRSALYPKLTTFRRHESGTKRAPPRDGAPYEQRAWNQCLQSGRPAASGGFVELLVEGEPVAVELVLLPLIVLLPLLVLPPLLTLGVSLRTCFVTASQHFPLLVVVVVERGEVVVVVEVCAAAIPMLPASMAAEISPIPIMRMRRILPSCGLGPASRRRDL